jgi:hypothetical protein
MPDAQFATYPSLKDRAVLHHRRRPPASGAELVRQFRAQGSRVAFLDFDEGELAQGGGGDGRRLPHCDLRDVAALRARSPARGAHRPLPRSSSTTPRATTATARDGGGRSTGTSGWRPTCRHIFFCAQAVAPGMRAARQGSIINMGSVSWMYGQGGMPAYTAAKSAVRGLTRGLARDLGGDGIRCNRGGARLGLHRAAGAASGRRRRR